MTEKIHPFTAAGMGPGPFRFVGSAAIPSGSLAGSNPAAYQAAMAQLPRHLVGGCGTCQCCGAGIANIMIVRNADGREYGVGTSCVEKTHATDRQMVRAARRVARECARQRARLDWEAAHPEEVAARQAAIEAQRAERQRAAEERQARRDQLGVEAVETFRPLLAVLADTAGGFAASVRSDILAGSVPRPGRCRDILCDIYGKAHGRRSSKAYCDAFEEIEAAFSAWDDARVREEIEAGKEVAA